MLTFEEVLEEIRNLPVGQEISEVAARTVASWYYTDGSVDIAVFVATGAVNTRDLFWQITANGENYLGASAEEKLVLDNLAMFLLSRGGIREGELESLWVDA